MTEQDVKDYLAKQIFNDSIQNTTWADLGAAAAALTTAQKDLIAKEIAIGTMGPGFNAVHDQIHADKMADAVAQIDAEFTDGSITLAQLAGIL